MPLSTSDAKVKISSSPLFSFRSLQQTAVASPAFIDLFYKPETGRFYLDLLSLKTLQTFTLFLTEFHTCVKEHVRGLG